LRPSADIRVDGCGYVGAFGGAAQVAGEDFAFVKDGVAGGAAASGDKPEEKKDAPASANPHLGKPCRMGQMYTKIHSNGNAYRCCLIKGPGLLGNLIDGTFALYEEPKSCSYDKCPCWVAMIVNEEKNWLFHWSTPKIKKEA
jgi:hypothetical protein